MNPTDYQRILNVCISHPNVKAEIDQRASICHCTDIDISIIGKSKTFVQYKVYFYYQPKKGSPLKHNDFYVTICEEKGPIYKGLKIFKI